jgi:hypothetical protein
MATDTVPFPKDWLLAAAEPWTRFHTKAIMGDANDRERAECLKHPIVRKLVADARGWPAGTTGAHQSAKDVLNKLSVLPDLGVRRGDAGIDAARKALLAGIGDDGLLHSPVILPRAKDAVAMFDVDGQDPLIAVAALGFGDDPVVVAATRALVALRKADGGFVWPNAKSPIPCRNDVGGCPYPALKLLRLLAHVPELADENRARPSTELLLSLWARRDKERRYGFGMGETFAKLKYPFIWFDILHFAEALSPFSWVWVDMRFREVIDAIASKADAAGRFTPESVWMAWKGQCFAQKNEPSRWLTVVIHRILARQPRASKQRRR